jgi:hypothetical protein
VVGRDFLKEKMAKKRESKKKRATSEDSNDGNSNVMSKFSAFEMETPADGAPLPHPVDFVPTLNMVTSDGVAVAMAAAPSEREPVAPDDLVPLHLIQGVTAQSVVVTPGSTAASIVVPGGLLKEPDAPRVMTRVTVEGAAPPAMRLELLSLLS